MRSNSSVRVASHDKFLSSDRYAERCKIKQEGALKSSTQIKTTFFLRVGFKHCFLDSVLEKLSHQYILKITSVDH